MGALVWPQLDKVFSNHRLRKAADIIRTQWCKARVEAMNSGCIRVFRYEIEGGNYRVEGLSAGSALLQNDIAANTASTDSTQVILGDNNTSPHANKFPRKTTPTLAERLFAWLKRCQKTLFSWPVRR